MESTEDFVNYYEIMGLTIGCSQDEIKKSYKQLALKYHPDVNKEGDANSRFKLIVSAYNTLKDAELRKQYDIEFKKNSGIKKILNFKYNYRKLSEKSDIIFRKIRLFFKNIYGEEINNNIKEDDILLKNVPKEILNMSLDELGERLLYSDNLYVRVHSAVAIGLKNEKGGLFYLEKKINDDSLEVRKAVVWALGNLKMKKSIQILKKMFYNGDSVLNLNILKSIEYITDGKGFIFDSFLKSSLQSTIDEVRLYALELSIKNKKNQNFDSLFGVFDKIKGSGDEGILSYNGG